MSDANSSSSDDDIQFDGGSSSSGNNDWAVQLLIRALFMIGFVVLAWFAFWALVILATVQFVVVCVEREPNKDLRRFSRNLVQYLHGLFAYVCFGSEERPFPFGPFPNVPDEL